MLHVYGTEILLSVSAFNHFYLATQHKERGYLQEARTIAELKKSYTQFVNADIIHRYINSNEHEKIEDITAHLLKNQVHFGDVSPSSRQHLFQAVTILNYIHKSYIEFRIQAQMQTKRFSADFESIYNKVYNVPGYIMPIATYRQLLSDYEKIWQQEFHHNVIKLHTNSSVNPIFISEDSVIHKERFKEYLSAHVTEMMNAIYKDLVDDMHTRILNRDLILALRYNNLSNMETLVLRLMKQKYAIMHHILLYYPHYYKKLLRRKIARHEFKATSEEIKRELPPEAFTHSAAHVAKERSKTPANNNAEQESDNEKSENEGESGNQSDSASNSESRNENESDSESNEGEKESHAPNKESRVLTTDKEPRVLITEPRARSNREPRYMMLFMLSLDPLRIFLGACRKLSFMRRLFYRLTSEYMDLHSHFKFLATVVKTQHVKHFPISRDARARSSEESAA